MSHPSKPSITFNPTEAHEIARCLAIANLVFRVCKMAGEHEKFLEAYNQLREAMRMAKGFDCEIMSDITERMKPYASCDDPSCQECRAQDYANQSKS